MIDEQLEAENSRLKEELNRCHAQSSEDAKKIDELLHAVAYQVARVMELDEVVQRYQEACHDLRESLEDEFGGNLGDEKIADELEEEGL